jgi:hypothetical protein
VPVVNLEQRSSGSSHSTPAMSNHLSAPGLEAEQPDCVVSVPMAARRIIEELYSQIERDRVRSVSGRYFIEQYKVREIFTADKIELAVSELVVDAHELVGLAKKIQQEGIIVFAILVWMRRPDYIVRFRNHECLNGKLPLHEARAQEIAPEFGLSFAREYQWEFLPYLFKEDMCDHHCQIDDLGVIFPFTGEVGDPIEGGFGQVSKLTIPTSLQRFFSTTVRVKLL